MSAGDLYAFYLGAVHFILEQCILHCVCVCACAHMFTHIVPPFSHRVHTHTHATHSFFPFLSLFLSHYANILELLDILISVFFLRIA